MLTQLTILHLLGLIDLRYADESAFNLQPNIPYGWIKEGEQREIHSQKGGNLNVFSLLNIQGNLTSYQTTQNVNALQIIDWLEDFKTKIELPTVVVMDNAPWHTAQAVDDKLAEWENQGLYIYKLPPYCPHLNLAETLWRKIKCEWLKPEDFLSKEALHLAINNILTNYNNEKFCIDFSINI